MYAFCLYQISTEDLKSFNVQHWESSDAAYRHDTGDWFEDANFSLLASRISALQLHSRNRHLQTVCQGEFIHLICPSANERVEINKCQRLTRLCFRYVRFWKEAGLYSGMGELWISQRDCSRHVEKKCEKDSDIFAVLPLRDFSLLLVQCHFMSEVSQR